MKNKLCIYVSSFDGCSDLWDTFFSIFKFFWKDCKFNIYLINNEIEYDNKDITVIHTGKEVNWFDRTIRSLEAINEEYIVFMLEDYFVSKNVYNDDFEEIIHYMDENSVYFYRLSLLPSIKKQIKPRYNYSEQLKYPISLQPAVWNKDRLLSILKEISGKTPWDFEYYYVNNYGCNRQLINGVAYDGRDLLGYKNGVLRGKWIPSTISFYKKMDITWDLGKREKLPLMKEYKYRTAVWFSNHISDPFNRYLKKILSFCQIDYLR